jgi:nitroimidazol reductase NimA-like FMN-containing flavoprotein (pyridoxamine 5'-phosphate oxidase superfamily)
MRTVEVDRNGLEMLDRDECLRLLDGEEVGRLAVVKGGAPVVFPVNFVLDGDVVVFRTDGGTKLAAAGRAPACFEVDWFDRRRRAGWSVVVAGRLEEVTVYDGAALERVRRLEVDPWAAGEKAHWLRLVPGRITGRRVGPGGFCGDGSGTSQPGEQAPSVDNHDGGEGCTHGVQPPRRR